MSHNNINTTNPYEYIHLNVEAIQDKPDQAPHNKQREVYDVENSMIDDTISLIKTLDGSATYDSRLLDPGSHEQMQFDTAIFLDKSARPVSRLLRMMWGNVSKETMPESKFLNIDKHPWLHEMGFNRKKENYEAISPDAIDLDRIDPKLLHDEITRIRALYLAPQDFSHLDENDLDDAWNMPTTLDGKRVAIIDEVKSSGNTLRIATELLKRAIPEAQIDGMWWSTPQLISWDGGEANDHKRQRVAKYVPAWYSEESTAGRGIDDIEETTSKNSPSKAQRIGKSILGTREKSVGSRNLSDIIRRDLSRLALRYANQELVRYRPDVFLPDDESDARVEAYYKRPSEEVYIQWRKEQGR